MRFRFYIAYALIGVGANSALAQNRQSDSTVFLQAILYHRQAYQTLMGQNTRLYNGTDYKEVILNPQDKGHPYFASTEWQKGFIEYDGQLYENVDLMYDIVGDKILTRQYAMSKKIELIADRVRSFSINGHTFIYVSRSDSSTKLPPGFYNKLAAGEVSAYVKRKKRFYEYIDSRQIVKDYKDETTYYLLKNGTVFPIKTKKELYRVMGVKKSLVKSEFRERNMVFRNQKEEALTLAAKIYNSHESR